MTDLLQNYYSQVKNPDPVFNVPEGKNTLPFCEKLMQKAAGFTHSIPYQMLIAMLRRRGLRKRRPPELRRRAIESALQALCFHWSPLANRVGASLTTMAIESGLATEKKRLSITRFTGAVKFLSMLGVVTYTTEYDKELGCNIPTDITFTPLFFEALDVSEEAVAAARRSRVEWENLQREMKGQSPLGVDELINRAWGFVRERFRQYHRERREHGLKRYQAGKDAVRTRKEVEAQVRKQMTQDIAKGRFYGNLDAVKTEIQRRVKERMVMSRGNYSRLNDDRFVTT
jgi:incFII family plasmid replication initiator RepA